MVISPLKALMKDQVNYLQCFGMPAVAVDELCVDAEILQQVINGTYQWRSQDFSEGEAIVMTQF